MMHQFSPNARRAVAFGAGATTIYLAMLLGPLAERSLRQSLLSSQGDPSIFFTRPISLACILIATALVLVPVYQKMKRKKANAKEGQET